MLFLWFYHACRRSQPRFLMVSDHINYLTFEDPGAVHTVRRALKLAHAGDLYGAAETAGVDVAHAAVVGEALRKGMRYSIGAEVDNDPRARPDAQNIVDAMRPDGIIRSVHFVPIDHPEKGSDFMWPYDNPEFANLFDHVGADRTWELYTARLFDDIEKLPGHIVGHFYRPSQFGHWPDQTKLEAYEDRLLELCHARGMAVEINSRGIYRAPDDEQRQKYIDANKRLMRKAKAANVGIAIGSDAHSPKDQGGAFDIVLQMLDECEINEVVFPVGGRLARVVLRATREHLEAQAQRPPETVQAGSSISGLSRAELGLPEEPEPQPRAPRATASRDAGPKKRASSPERTTKRPASEEEKPKSSSKRTAESAASSAKSKESKETKEPKEAKEPKAPAEPKPAKAVKKAAEAPAPVKKAAAPVKKAPAPKKAPPEKKTAAAKKAPAAKAAAPVKKAPAKKAAPVKKAAAPAKKAAPVKKTAAKKTASSAKKTSAKKTVAKKAPAKKAAPVKAVAKKKKSAPAKSVAVKKAVKTTAKSSKGTTKKKSTKRR